MIQISGFNIKNVIFRAFNDLEYIGEIAKDKEEEGFL